MNRLDAEFPPWQRICRLVAERHYLALADRVRLLEIKSPDRRYAVFCEGTYGSPIDRLPIYHLSSYLAIAPEHLKRLHAGR